MSDLRREGETPACPSLTVEAVDGSAMQVPTGRFTLRRLILVAALVGLNLAGLCLTRMMWPASADIIGMHSTDYILMPDGSVVAQPQHPTLGRLGPPPGRPGPRELPRLDRPPMVSRLCLLWLPLVACSGITLLALGLVGPAAGHLPRFTIMTMLSTVAMAAILSICIAFVARPPTDNPYTALWMIRGTVPLAAVVVSSLSIVWIVRPLTSRPLRAISRRFILVASLVGLNLAGLCLTIMIWPVLAGSSSLNSTQETHMPDGSVVAQPMHLISGLPWGQPTLEQPPQVSRLCLLWLPLVACSGITLLAFGLSLRGRGLGYLPRFSIMTMLLVVAAAALGLAWIAFVARPPEDHPFVTLWAIRAGVPLATLLVSSLSISLILRPPTPHSPTPIVEAVGGSTAESPLAWFSARRIMVAAVVAEVAFIAVALGVLQWEETREGYRQEAVMHRQMEWGYGWMACYIDPARSPYLVQRMAPGGEITTRNGLDGLWISSDGKIRHRNGRWIVDDSERAALAADYVKKASDYGRLRRAYERAARHPWFAAPDEPLPHEQVWGWQSGPPS